MLCIFLSFLCFLSFSSALDINGKVQWNNECQDIRDLHSSRVVLDNGMMKGSIARDGSFVIPEVSVGTYILSVLSPNYSFDQLRIDILANETIPEIRPYAVGTPLNPPSPVLLTYPITLIPKQRHAYFIPLESFDLVAMFSNPMMLMMVVGGAMMLAMPYLMKNMDPESMEEFKEQHAKVSRFQNAIANGDIKSGFSTHDEPSNVPVAIPNTKSSSTIKNRGNKNKKR